MTTMTTEQTPPRPLSPFEAARKSEMMDAEQRAFEGLVLSEPRSRLPEPLFREHFWPYFNHDREVQRDQNVFAQWVGVAGSPTSEVDVVNEKGDIVFTVPALLNTGILNVLKSDHQQQSIKETFQETSRLAADLPDVATTFFQKMLQHKLGDISSNRPPQEKDVQNWKKIAEYYGTATPDAATAQTTKVDPDDELQYD